MVEHDTRHCNEHSLETKVRRVVSKLTAFAEDKALAPAEHCRLLRDFERLLEIKVQRRRGL